MINDITENKKGDESPAQNQDKDKHFEIQYKTVYQSFKERPKTTLEVAIESGILRNCITWYVAEMEEKGLIQIIRKGADPFTHFKAGFYSTDEALFKVPEVQQLNLFGYGI